MKLIKDRLLAGCGITVLILFCFFTFVSVDTGITFQMTFSSFLIIFGMSLLVSLAALIFKMDSFPYAIRLIMHFLSLLGVLFALLGSTGVLAGKSTAQYFLLCVGYTFLYAIVSLIIFGFKKLYAFVIDKYFPAPQPESKGGKSSQGKSSVKKNTPHNSKKNDGKKDGEGSSYKPLYK